jgi:hypothetical protein
MQKLSRTDFRGGRLARLLQLHDLVNNPLPAGSRTLHYHAENDPAAVHSRAADHDALAGETRPVLLEDELRASHAIRAGATVFRLNSRDTHVQAINLASAGGWGAAGAAAADPATTLSPLNLRRCSASITYSTFLAASGGIEFSKMLYLQLHAALAASLDRAAFAGDGEDDVPLGLLHDPGVAAYTIADPPELADFLEQLADAEAGIVEGWNGEPTCFVSPRLREALRLAPSTAAAGEDFAPIANPGLAAAMPLPPIRSTAALEGMTAILGDFRSLAIGHAGEIMVQVNPFSRDAEGYVRITASGYFDVVAARPSAFARLAPAAAEPE